MKESEYSVRVSHNIFRAIFILTVLLTILVSAIGGYMLALVIGDAIQALLYVVLGICVFIIIVMLVYVVLKMGTPGLFEDEKHGPKP